MLNRRNFLKTGFYEGIIFALITALALLLAFSMVAVATGGPPGGAPGHFIVALNEGVDSESAAEDLSRAHGLGIGQVFDTVLNGFSATVPLDRVRAVESDSRVRVVVEDTFTPDALGSHVQNLPTGIDRINAEPTGSTINTGVGVSIAILDTGIAKNHADLNVVSRITFATGGDGDKNGHGTHVSVVYPFEIATHPWGVDRVMERV